MWTKKNTRLRQKHQTSVKNAAFMSATVSSDIIPLVNWKENRLYAFAMKVAFPSF